MYHALVQYRDRFGSTDVPKSYTIHDGNTHGLRGRGGGKTVALGRWVSRQRVSFAQGVLREDRVRLLDGIGFVWSVPVKKMLENIELEPLDFRDVHDGASLASALPDNRRRDGGHDHDHDSVSCSSLLSSSCHSQQSDTRRRFLPVADAAPPLPSGLLPPEFVVVTRRSERPAPAEAGSELALERLRRASST
jgi:hypothetical protein